MKAKDQSSQSQPENTKEDLQNHTARDGFDNTGTQGYDSLKDAGYTGSSPATDENQRSGTGSSSEAFHEVPSAQDEEDQALDAGI